MKKSKLYGKKFNSIIVIAMLMASVLTSAMVMRVCAPGESWLPGWSYRKSHVIQGAAGAGAGYQVRITTHYGGILPGASRFMNLQKYSSNPLDVPEGGFYGTASGDVHPDVLYFPSEIDGYKYWITYTPYPPGTTEHPSISRSNDGITWTDSGITNPVVTSDTPSTIEDADPDFKYVPDLDEWFMVWTVYRMSDGYSQVGFAYSLDGKTWTKYDGGSVNGNINPIILDSADSNGQPTWEASGGISRVTEPSLLYENGKFYLFYATYVGGNNRGKCGFATFTWDKTNHNIQNLQRYTGNPVVDLPSDSIFASGCGHDDISKFGSTYYLYVDRQLASSSNFELALLTSTDKTTWTYQGRVLQRGSPGWDDTHIYRSAPTTDGIGNIIDFSGSLKLYYSAFSTTVSSGIGLATGTDAPPTPAPPDSGEDVYLNQHSRIDFGDVRFTGSDGTTQLDYWMEKKVDGDYATFWVKVADDLSTTDRTIYVYYGKSDATTTSNIKAASLWNAGDDFNDNSLDTTVWDTYATPSSSAGAAIVQDSGNPNNRYLQFNLGFCAGVRTKTTQYADNLEMSIKGYANTYVELYLHNTKLTSSDMSSARDGIDTASSYRIMLENGGVYAQKRWSSSGMWYQLYKTYPNPCTLKLRVTGGNIAFLAGDTQFYSEAWDTRISRDNYFIIEGYGNSGKTDWADSFWTRKYVSPEPSHGSWGIEEQLGTKLYVDPPLTEKNHSDVGTSFQVNMTVTDITDLQGFDFNLTWDSSLITLASVDFNTTLDKVWGNGNWYSAVNQSGAGYYKLVAVSTANSFNSTGPTPLCQLVFTVQDPQSNFVRETPIHFDTHKLSGSQANPITHTVTDGTYRITGKTPSLQMSPTSKTCRKYNETFTIQVSFSDAFNVTDFEFEIHYDTTLLGYSGITWNAWAYGSITVDEVNGVVSGSTSGGMLSGNQILVTIEFKAGYYRIWKDLPGWVNDQAGKIFIQSANLSYPGALRLRYVKGGLNEINVGPDVTYAFSPIQGDIDNNGSADVFDLRTVAAYYDQPNATYNLTGDSTIDIFDLVVIGANFGYTYSP